MPNLTVSFLLNYKLQFAIPVFIPFTVFSANRGMGRIVSTAPEAPSNGLYTWSVLTGCWCWKKEPMYICRPTGLIHSGHLWASRLWVLSSKADCNLTTESFKNKLCTWERCHLVCLGLMSFYAPSGNSIGSDGSWFSSNHFHKLADTKESAHISQERGLHSLRCPSHLWFPWRNCQQPGNKGKAGHVQCQLWWCNHRSYSFSARKKRQLV